VVECLPSKCCEALSSNSITTKTTTTKKDWKFLYQIADSIYFYGVSAENEGEIFIFIPVCIIWVLHIWFPHHHPVLGIEPRALNIVGEHSTTELYLQPRNLHLL
jgi:hypothetical protein